MKNKIKDHSLYLVISEEYALGRSALEVARLAIAGGVDIIQMREKDKKAPELLELGLNLAELCEKNGVTFIVNDNPYLAKKVDADGVHLGQEDIAACTAGEARRIMGKGKIVGVSTHSFDEFCKANSEDADYIAFGPVFPTKTKNYHIGTGDIQKVIKVAAKPVFFIGGINLSNIDEVLSKGAKNIALIRGITEAADITAAAKEFKAKLKGVIHEYKD